MKRTFVHLAALAVCGAARQNSVPLHGSASTELSVEGLRMLGYPQATIEAAERRAIEDATRQMLRDLEANFLERMPHTAEPTVYAVAGYQAGKTMRLYPWQEKNIELARKQAMGAIFWPAGWGSGWGCPITPSPPPPAPPPASTPDR